jgi:16S rRNA (guanine527-N7)-methyltransferase
MAHKNKDNVSPYKKRQPGGPRSLQGKHERPEQIYGLEEANDRLADIFKNHHFDGVTHEQRKALARFYQLLMEQQQTENFTRLLKLRDIAIKHFIDCLVIVKHTQLKFPLLDVGTGPGLPGIPLKILFPQDKIILAEGVQKRVEFLKKVRDDMKLQKLEIIGRNIGPDFMYPVQGVITRAVEDIRNSLKNVQNSLEVGGRAFFMKGPNVDPEIKTAVEEWGQYFELVEDIHYSLPETTHERRLVIFEKIKHPEILEDEE